MINVLNYYFLQVLSTWKLTLKNQTDSNENVDNPEAVDEMGKRLLRLVEEEEFVRDINVEEVSIITFLLMKIFGN